jgi:hypothetical protein
MSHPKSTIFSVTAQGRLLAGAEALPQLVSECLQQLQQPDEFAKALRVQRQNWGMTQEQLAQHYGVSARTYKR